MSNSVELITWIPVSIELPDDQETVLTNVPECGEPVWLGWYDDGTWHQIDGGEIAFPVTHWAKMPRGAVAPSRAAQCAASAKGGQQT